MVSQAGWRLAQMFHCLSIVLVWVSFSSTLNDVKKMVFNNDNVLITKHKNTQKMKN